MQLYGCNSPAWPSALSASLRNFNGSEFWLACQSESVVIMLEGSVMTLQIVHV